MTEDGGDDSASKGTNQSAGDSSAPKAGASPSQQPDEGQTEVTEQPEGRATVPAQVDISPPYDDYEIGSSGATAPEYDKFKTASVEDVTHADKVRKLIVVWLLSILSGTIALGMASVATTKWTTIPADDIRTFFQIVFSAVVTLVSTAVGFYFGTEVRRQGQSKE